MSSIPHDHDLLLEAPSPTDASLAQELLESRGIPSVLYGADRYNLAFGASANQLTRPDLYVPKGMRERARAVLDEAWGGTKRDDS